MFILLCYLPAFVGTEGMSGVATVTGCGWRGAQ